MEFTKDELLPILNNLIIEGKINPKCKNCNSDDIKFDPKIFRIQEYTGKTIDLLSSQRVFLIKTCQNCGYTEFYDALVLGLIDPVTGELKKNK
ncbi:hypothetical protein [Marinitoga lauensis]|uniref:hypothetical protein n=1 Tax=Marinitoga lauensis TaxID=2201189 RepID=UPI0010134BCC|nr:hypothetical protein [Marinitoga lauensis]